MALSMEILGQSAGYGKDGTNLVLGVTSKSRTSFLDTIYFVWRGGGGRDLASFVCDRKKKKKKKNAIGQLRSCCKHCRVVIASKRRDKKMPFFEVVANSMLQVVSESS